MSVSRLGARVNSEPGSTSTSQPSRAHEPESPAGSVDRIELLGNDALVVSDGGDDEQDPVGTHLLSIVLAEVPSTGAEILREGRIELEDRSHAFNWTSRDGDLLMGLPFARLERDARIAGAFSLVSEPVSIIEYFEMEAPGMLKYVGVLEEDHRATPPPDDCETSCFDWYGAVRPIFLDDRVFGLIGDELVEASHDGGAIREIQRIRMRRTD